MISTWWQTYFLNCESNENTLSLLEKRKIIIMYKLQKLHCTNRWAEGQLLLATFIDKFINQVTVDSTTGHGLASNPSLELDFRLNPALNWTILFLPSSCGWRKILICCSNKHCSCERETNYTLMTLGSFLVPIVSTSNSFVKLSGCPTTAKQTRFPGSAFHALIPFVHHI